MIQILPKLTNEVLKYHLSWMNVEIKIPACATYSALHQKAVLLEQIMKNNNTSNY